MGIKDERIKHGLTQQQLSKLTGIPFRSIQNWEGGQRKCPDYVERLVLEKLDRLFNQPDYQQIVMDLIGLLEDDLPHFETVEARRYVKAILGELYEAIKKEPGQ